MAATKPRLDPSAIVIVEGVSDEVALRTLAERRGRDLAGEGVRILRPGQPARYVAARASDVARGTVVLKRGAAVGPQQAAVLATVGAWEVEAFDRPRVAVLATGNEVAAAGEDAGEARIRNSNSPMLTVLLRRLGCVVTDLGVCRDEPDALRAKLAEGLAHDALFVSGGMSMGAYDYVPRVLRDDLRADLRITKLRIKPGKPFVFATVVEGSGFGVRGSSRAEGATAAGRSPNPRFVFGLPGIVLRVLQLGAGLHLEPLLASLIFGFSIVSAAFLVTWVAEAAGQAKSDGLYAAGSTSTIQLPELSRQTASTPYGRSEGSWRNSTPFALSSSAVLRQSSTFMPRPCMPPSSSARPIARTMSGECGGPGTVRWTASSGWLGWCTVHQR